MPTFDEAEFAAINFANHATFDSTKLSAFCPAIETAFFKAKFSTD